jgi:hypothetical protein
MTSAIARLGGCVRGVGTVFDHWATREHDPTASVAQGSRFARSEYGEEAAVHR